MTIREQQETLEHEILSPRAAFADESCGRERPEEECPMRTPFQRDRDRILHCNAFRRLTHKTQVFLSPEGDHYRTRLTHTLEVSQIARTLSRALRLNEDLTEAIALGHDLGHTPFGHAGEYALQDVFDPEFHHAAQSIRVVTKLERDGRGLNLTGEVREGILAHSDGQAWSRTQEGRVVRYADPVAKSEEGKAKDIVRYLYGYYVANPHRLPDFYRGIAEEEGAPRAAADFISGMSDRYCVDLYESMVIPRSWSVL